MLLRHEGLNSLWAGEPLHAASTSCEHMQQLPQGGSHVGC